MKLHLGCGNNILSGWVNVDHESTVADLSVDLTVMPWPWGNNSVDEILMQQVLEHFDRPELILAEAYRILKPGGKITVEVPHASSTRAYSIDHKAVFARCFFEGMSRGTHYFTSRNSCCFSEIKYAVKLIGRLRWTPFDWIASRWPIMWEKLSDGIFRPTEILWIARKPND